MPLTSMTGFARADGAIGVHRWTWELKSVNGRGLDLRFRVPAGFDRVEADARALAGQVLARGNCSLGLVLSKADDSLAVRVNEAAVAAFLGAIEHTPGADRLSAPSWDGLLALRGVVEVVEPEQDAEALAALHAGIGESFGEALNGLVAIRREEGARLGRIVAERLEQIETLATEADHSPARAPERIRDKLARTIRDLTDAAPTLDADRLHQEAVLLAAKADIREEIDRLHAHVAAARDLLAAGDAVGRRLDFLAQEFNREANTLCSKASDVEVTRIGLEIKAQVEQFREQVQNIE